MSLTVIYATGAYFYFAEISTDLFSAWLVSSIVMPHLLCVWAAAIVSIIGFFGRKNWAMITSGILMAVSALLMRAYAPMVIIQTVLFFIAYVRMSK